MLPLQTSLPPQEDSPYETAPLVLVVDDQPAIRDMLSWALHLQGYQAVCTANGQEALAWIDHALETGCYPAVILLDLLMPVMNGTAFLNRLRARWNAPVPLPPIILLTVVKSNYDHLGCSCTLMKPFHISDLWKSLKLVMHGSVEPADES